METKHPIHGLFHTLWSKAVGTPEYNKREWQRLEQLILELLRQRS
jgi:hypothetical protein